MLNIFYALSNVAVTCEIKLFRNYFCLCRCPSEIILFQRVETCLEFISKLFRAIIAAREYFQHVQCR